MVSPSLQSSGSSRLIAVDDIAPADIIIVLLGQSGTGKSTFINTVTESDVVSVGYRLDPCTTDIQCVRWTAADDKGGRSVVFVDTPASGSETEDERKITRWLEMINARRKQVTGILYLHRITDIKMTEAPSEHLKLFEKLCGRNYSQKMVFVTTMWTKADLMEGVGYETSKSAREEELRTKYLNVFLKKGSNMIRFEGTAESAWRAVNLALGNSDEQIVGLKGLNRSSRLPPASQLTKIEKVKVESFSPDDIVIALMGPTGSGKSTFIERATGQKGETIGHPLQSFTAKVRAVRVAHPGDSASVVFVDTPGFDDTYKPDTEILHLIADWLEKTYKNDVKLAGIIYLHRISDNRMSGSPYRNLRMFAKLCGDDAIRNVVLVTTMWSRVKPDVGSRREKELAEKFWKSMLDYGSKMDRFYDTREGAWRIVERIVEGSTTDPLLLQEEMVDLRKRLSETEAGITLHKALLQSLAQQMDVIRRLEEEVEKHIDSQLTLELLAQYEQIQEAMRITVDQIEEMKIPLGRQIRMFFTLKRTRAHALKL